jgi:hypothetical protein
MKRVVPICLVPLVLCGCPRRGENLDIGEARAALEEASSASEADNLSGSTIEISTSFTIGQGVERAAQELRDFVASQLPCAELTLVDGTLDIVFGATQGACVYNGHTYSGEALITVHSNEQNEIVVEHEWIDLSNGRIKLNGGATVTWNLAEATRHVEHTATWTNLSTGRTFEGSGDRTQRPLAGGVAEGIRVDGTRSWKSDRGQWDLAINGVEMRWTDPVPQAGSYSLTTPADKSLSLSFLRKDVDTIGVTISSGKREFSFDVTKLGAVESSS